MGKFNLLSVAEDDYNSDRITSKQESYNRVSGVNAYRTVSLQLSVNTNRLLTIQFFREGVFQYKIEFPDLDLDGMIEYLQEVKTFISEEDMIKKLRGINVSR